jgi:hypothetical protein
MWDQPYGPPWPDTGIALLIFFLIKFWVNNDNATKFQDKLERTNPSETSRAGALNDERHNEILDMTQQLNHLRA